eukprot:1095979-Prorocentrum_minimum.AAC.1
MEANSICSNSSLELTVYRGAARAGGNATRIFGTLSAPKLTETGGSGRGTCDLIRLLTHPRTPPTDRERN